MKNDSPPNEEDPIDLTLAKLDWRQLFEQDRQVTGGFGGVHGRGVVTFIQFIERFDESARPPAASPQVDQLVAGDRMQPGRHRHRCIEGAALQMNSQQGLLHQILHVVRCIAEAAAEVAAQPLRHQAQGTRIGRFVARLAGDPLRPQRGLDVIALPVHRLVRSLGRSGYRPAWDFFRAPCNQSARASELDL